MAITIFSICRGSRSMWLQVNADGSVTYHEEHSDPFARQSGCHSQERTMTVCEAMQDWESYADELERAHQAVSKVGRGTH